MKTVLIMSEEDRLAAFVMSSTRCSPCCCSPCYTRRAALSLSLALSRSHTRVRQIVDLSSISRDLAHEELARARTESEREKAEYDCQQHQLRLKAFTLENQNIAYAICMKHALLGAEDVGEIGERACEEARGAVGLRQAGVGVAGIGDVMILNHRLPFTIRRVGGGERRAEGGTDASVYADTGQTGLGIHDLMISVSRSLITTRNNTTAGTILSGSIVE